MSGTVDKTRKPVEHENSRPATMRQKSHATRGLLATSTEAVQLSADKAARLTSDHLMALQRSAGNRAVTILQAKLTVGAAGDAYEQEADRVAEQVVGGQGMEAGGRDLRARRPESQAQRQVEEEEVQTKPMPVTITPLVRRQPVDEEEVQTMRLQRQEEEEEPLQAKRLQRQPVEEEEPLQASRLQRQPVEEEEVQTKSVARDSLGAFDPGPGVEDRLRAGQGRGNELPAEVRTHMESRFGADFSGVRVHTGGEAAELNRAISARAFTHGQDVYMGEGQYDPGSTAGKRLLAHELTHVVQQTGPGARRKPLPQMIARAEGVTAAPGRQTQDAQSEKEEAT